MTDNLQIQLLADKAASEYINNKIPLNDSITKIAKEESLSPEAIARVVERANTGVQTALFAENGAKEYFEFPLASTTDILMGLNVNAIGEDLALKESSSKVEDKVSKTKLAKWTKDWSESDWDPNSMTPSQALVMTMEKFAAAEEEMRGRVIESEAALEKSAKEFVDKCKQGIAAGDFTIDELAADIFYYRPKIKDLSSALIKEAYDQTHHTRPVDSSKSYVNVPPAFLTHGTSRPVKVIDANHSLLEVLDTLVEQARMSEHCNQGLMIVSDKAKYVKSLVNEHLVREYEKDVR